LCLKHRSDPKSCNPPQGRDSGCRTSGDCGDYLRTCSWDDPGPARRPALHRAGLSADHHVSNTGHPTFSGFPVAFILGGLAFTFGIIGYFLDMFSLIEFFNFMPRIWFQAAENLVLVAVPAFVFMGVMMERSGVANDLLYCVQVLLKKVAGSLALAVVIMGTVLAAMTGIIGASVTMMTALALPTMIKQGYKNSLSCGCIAASGTLGILIPPSIMLIIMADLMAVSVGN
ncbi:uncharacterized protein METZ01_LOCUS515429, partial [marine metagenome]